MRDLLLSYGLLARRTSETSETSEDEQQNAYPPKGTPPSDTNSSNGDSGNIQQEESPDLEQGEEGDFQNEFHFDSREVETEDAEVLE